MAVASRVCDKSQSNSDRRAHDRSIGSNFTNKLIAPMEPELRC